MLPKQDLAWWYWLATVPLLTAGVLGETRALSLAALLILIQIAQFYNREKSISAFPVQVRVAYFAWFILGLLPYMEWMLWLQMLGTSLSILLGYCPMARLLALAPWNRRQPLTVNLALRVWFAKPVAGSILDSLRY